MALVKQTLADALETAFSRENSAKEAAEAIATAIDGYRYSFIVVLNFPYKVNILPYKLRQKMSF